MTEYSFHLNEYSSKKYLLYSRTIQESKWGNITIARKYCEKYWLSESEYLLDWKPVQNSIFVNYEKGLPDLFFAKGYELIALRGGVLFTEEDFKQLQECMRKVKDKYFVIIENNFGGKLKTPPFRLKYSVDISWKELTSGNFLSSILFEMFHKEYFVYGDSGVWGKYAANDYINPLDLLGFKGKYSGIFRENFKTSEEEQNEIRTWLPDEYKKRFLIN